MRNSQKPSDSKKKYIRHIETYLPKQELTNATLAQLHPEWDMDSIGHKTGVFRRRRAMEGECASDLAYCAAQELMARLPLPKDSIDCVIFCSLCPDYIAPHTSALLQHRLGFPTRTIAFDLILGCSGYLYSIAIGKALMESLNFQRVLLLTGDTLSRYSHSLDTTTVTLLGDGASASLLEFSQGESGIIDIELGTDGGFAEKAIIRAGGMRLPRSEATQNLWCDVLGNWHSDECFFFNGRAIVNFVTETLIPATQRFLDRNFVAISDLHLVLFHQASGTILKLLQDAFGLRASQVHSNLADVGNTSSSSLPILLKDAESRGKLKRGDLILLVGFGTGVSWGSCLLRW